MESDSVDKNQECKSRTETGQSSENPGQKPDSDRLKDIHGDSGAIGGATVIRHLTKAGQRTGQSRARLSKDHQDYWVAKLRKRTYRTADGRLMEIPEWQVRITYKGREAWFHTHSAHRIEAAIRAREIYRTLVSPTGGWEAALKMFKPEMAQKKADPTVGEFLAEIEKRSGLKPMTFGIYARKFRSLVAYLTKIPGDGKHDHIKGKYKDWLAKVHAVKLSRLTPERIQAWKVAYVKRPDPLQVKRAKVSANSILRNSKALFSPKVLRFVQVEMPEKLPFDGVEFEKVGKSRYKSEINPELLSVAAHNELKTQHPEEFKIFLLALGAGLRRDEIDTLTWEQLNPQRGTIRVETNCYTEAKSSDSEAEVHVDSDLMAQLLAFKAGSDSPFVINSEIEPRPAATYHHYRCQRYFDNLIIWLRKKGITTRNAIHSLRKEFGSLICAQGGIYQASEQLRHSDIRITRDSYLDRKNLVVVKLAMPTEPQVLPSEAAPEGSGAPRCARKNEERQGTSATVA